REPWRYARRAGAVASGRPLPLPRRRLAQGRAARRRGRHRPAPRSRRFPSTGSAARRRCESRLSPWAATLTPSRCPPPSSSIDLDADGAVGRPQGGIAMMRKLCGAMVTTALLVTPAGAADGELDTEHFYPPDGRIGFVGGGLVADGGLVDPDGMAVALMRLS